ncbi:hypothetical protein Tsubulata_030658 [Turnera subulata]|uniref:Ubiquitin-like protease family profile domain-containing protein n=1 Tax=Turnera subulata TaxID=218843 RepID=A0A9Q0FUQ8_9ROSI|nr:hypothetical protein Tsubulata_030658 [Turnera subulata]
MGKKKQPTKTTPIIHLDSSSAEDDADQPSSHGTEALNTRSKKITKNRTEEIAPCALKKTIPRRGRSNRGSTRNNANSEVNEKLGSKTFDCYMENLWSSFSEEKRKSFTYLECYWFCMYREASYRENVLQWIKRKQIFLKKYVIVPIVCWYISFFAISLTREAFSLFAIRNSTQNVVAGFTRDGGTKTFVWDIYRTEGRPETKQMVSKIPLLVPKVPQQKNDVDCGKFVLYFIKLFMQDAPENFNMEDYPYFMDSTWFTLEGVENFWEKLESLKIDLE